MIAFSGPRVAAVIAAVALIGAGLAAPARAQSPVATPPANHMPAAERLETSLSETIDHVPVTVHLLNGRTVTASMVVTHFRPPGAGPFPAIVLNHGRNSKTRQTPPRARLLPLVKFWTRRGFAVVVPTRVGYGALGQAIDPEAMGRCSSANYAATMDTMATQIVAAARYAGRLPHVASGRVLTLGISYGGFGVLAASARRNPGFVAAINFVGGMGGSRESRPGRPCRGDRITQIAHKLGTTARVPTLWLYSENDMLWGADWPRRWHRAYVAAGGKAEFRSFPPVADDGHLLPGRGRQLWRPVTDHYIERLGFAVPKADSTLPASGFANLDEADKVPHITAAARERGYMQFLRVDVPRAFALAPSGAWSWRRGPDAATAALANCQQRARLRCRLYAVDDRVVWPPSVPEQQPGQHPLQ